MNKLFNTKSLFNMNNIIQPHSMFSFMIKIILPLLSVVATFNEAFANEATLYECPTSKCVYQTLKIIKPGDTLMLEGGKVYEINKSFKLEASGSKDNRITFSSKDKSSQHRHAIISTVGGKKEENLTAIKVTGSFWDLSRLEISGKRIPLKTNYWDVNGFRIGLYLDGAAENNIEDIHIHHTHNAAVAIRKESHHNSFRRVNIHHIGEWLNKDYNAHEGEGFYIGSSKGMDKAGNKARVHDILIEDSIIGPGVLGQYVDIKYGASAVTVRQNTFNAWEIPYNEEIIKLAGFANHIVNNNFIGSHQRLKQYIYLVNKKTKNPVRVDYRGLKNIPAPSGRDNTIANNTFYTDNQHVVAIKNELKAAILTKAKTVK